MHACLQLGCLRHANASACFQQGKHPDCKHSACLDPRRIPTQPALAARLALVCARRCRARLREQHRPPPRRSAPASVADSEKVPEQITRRFGMAWAAAEAAFQGRSALSLLPRPNKTTATRRGGAHRSLLLAVVRQQQPRDGTLPRMLRLLHRRLSCRTSSSSSRRIHHDGRAGSTFSSSSFTRVPGRQVCAVSPWAVRRQVIIHIIDT